MLVFFIDKIMQHANEKGIMKTAMRSLACGYFGFVQTTILDKAHWETRKEEWRNQISSNKIALSLSFYIQ